MMPKLAVLGLFVVLATSCGSDSGDPTAGSVAPDRVPSSSGVPGTLTDPAAPQSSIEGEPSAGCPLDQEQVSRVVGSRLQPIDGIGDAKSPGDPADGAQRSGDLSCAFESPDWFAGVGVAPLEPEMTATTAPVPTIEGIDREHFGHIDLDRSGRWNAEIMVTDGQQMFTLTVTNNASGSDTYPPTDGPPQREPTLNVVKGLVELLPG